jgi:hypothetical protein
MTVCPELDLANHFRFIVMYDDGSEDVFAVPEATLDQGPDALQIIAAEWQADGFIKEGRIVALRVPGRFVLH